MKLPKKVNIYEVGPRDGFQNESKFIETEKKIDIINRVVDSGIRQIEIGSFVHPKAVPQMKDTETVIKKIKRKEGATLRALVPNLKGTERAINAGVDKIKLMFSATESHNISNANKSRDESFIEFEKCVVLAKEHNIPVAGGMAVAFGCPFEGDVPINELKILTKKWLSIGVSELVLADTTGMANPLQVYSLCSELRKTYPEVNWYLHLHNTRGLALANIVAAMQAGIVSFDSSFAGLGGCPYAPGASGNASSEDIVHMCEEMGIKTGIDLDKAIELAKLVKDLVGHETESYMLRAGKVKDLIKEKPKEQKKMC